MLLTASSGAAWLLCPEVVSPRVLRGCQKSRETVNRAIFGKYFKYSKGFIYDFITESEEWHVFWRIKVPSSSFRLMLIQNAKTLKENAVCMCNKLGESEFIL